MTNETESLVKEETSELRERAKLIKDRVETLAKFVREAIEGQVSSIRQNHSEHEVVAALFLVYLLSEHPQASARVSWWKRDGETFYRIGVRLEPEGPVLDVPDKATEAYHLKLELSRLDGLRDWVLRRKDPREGAIFLFSWVLGVCSAAGYTMKELKDLLDAPPEPKAKEEPAKKGRHITEVLAEVILLIPKEEHEFWAALEKVREDATYVAPEMQGRCWLAAGEVFHRRFGPTPPTSGWGKDVADIFIKAMQT